MSKDLIQINLEQDEYINSFLDAVDEFISSPKFNENYFETYIQALRVFLNLPKATNTILYLIDTESFEFQYTLSEPKVKDEFAIEKLNYYIDNGAIGKVLQNSQIYVFPNVNECDGKYDCMIIPLIASWGFIGLVLVRIEDGNDLISKLILRLCNNHANIFAGVIERVEINRKLIDTKSELEQRIAVKTMELEIRGRELKSIMDSVQTGIMVTDFESNEINRVNYIASNMLGLDESEILNRNVSDFIDYYDNENLFSQESYIILNNSENIPILLKISFVNLGNKNYKIYSFVDISVRKKAENQLKYLNENLEQTVLDRTLELKLLVNRLETEIVERKLAEAEIRRMLDFEKEVNEMKSKFITMVSHEFRTPLTIIKSSAQFVDTFYDKLSFEDKKNYLNRISTTVDFITNLLENILFIEKSNNNKILNSISEINIINLINEIIDELNMTNKVFRKHIINNNLKNDFINSDEKLLKLILINVITNSFKYSENESLVEIELLKINNEICIDVIDKGFGIEKTDLDLVFELFFRGKNVSNIQGTGLGLSVVKDCIEKLNYRCQLDSELNKGTSFKLFVKE